MAIITMQLLSCSLPSSINKTLLFKKMSVASAAYEGAVGAGSHIYQQLPAFLAIALLFIALSPGYLLNVPVSKDCENNDAVFFVGGKKVPPTMLTVTVHSLVFVFVLAVLFRVFPKVYGGLVPSA